MLNFAGCKALKTVSDVASLSGGSTIYMHFRLGDLYSSVGIRTLFWVWGVYIYVDKVFSSNGLVIVHSGSVSDGQWMCSLPSLGINTDIQIAITYDFSAGTPAAPIVYANGEARTVIEVTAPDGAVAISTGPLLVGGMSHVSPTYPFEGYIGEWGVKVGTKLTAAQMANLTGSRMMRQPLQYGFTHYWAMDEIADGIEYAVAGTPLVADGDLLTPWGSATPHWSRINAEDATYLAAGPADDNETEGFTCTTDTVPANRKVGAMAINVKGYKNATADSPSVFTTLSSGVSVSLPSSNGWVALAPTFLNLLAQADVDALQLYIDSPTMGSEANIYIDQITITFYYIWNRIIDYASGNYLVGTTGAQGVANRYLSY